VIRDTAFNSGLHMAVLWLFISKERAAAFLDFLCKVFVSSISADV